ncbi:Mif2/CENP-C like-domain-containing protein [Panaeolus papilionaceus]|nr:Mif2/CENP-C like-domain-containing protein [Panaeolus papilionaceus]
MPSSARKSSISGLRRGPQKAHIPYRGDNPEVGKKTGIAVQHVERKSDGFEPFEDIMQQADGRTPPRPKNRKKSLGRMRDQDADYYYDDEDGEQSMEIDSPMQHLSNMRPAHSPLTSGRRSSMRPVARTSEINFDDIPSPRPLGSSSRHAGPGPSSLSRSTRMGDYSPEIDTTYNNDYSHMDQDDDDDDDDDNGMGNDYGAQEASPPPSSRRTTFAQMDQDEDEDMEEEEDNERTPTQNHKQANNRRRVERSPSRGHSNEDIEDDIAQGLQNVDDEPMEEDESEEEPAPPPPKKSKKEKEGPKKQVIPLQNRSKKENREPAREGVRRSKREHFKPLEWWRGERYVYGRTVGSGPVLVPQIKEIVRIPKEPPPQLGGSKRKRSRARSKSKTVEDGVYDIPPARPVENPEEGWDDATEAKCVVLHYTTQEEVTRRIAWTAKMVEPKMAADHNWSFDKIFGDDDFIAAGQLIIPPQGRKPSKAAKDNTYVFYVIEGAVNFKIHNTSMILSTGGMFMVPRGNMYLIENISNRDARLFFTQARKVEMNADEQAVKQKNDAAIQKRNSVRSSSAGLPQTSKSAANAARAASLAALPAKT